MEYLAHIRADGTTQSVNEHLQQTAQLAAGFAAAFDAEGAGRTAGLLHDIGKYSAEFQARIRSGKEKVDHSTAGAQIALERQLPPIAFAVAGHHAGIPDGGSSVDPPGTNTMVGRSRKQIPEFGAWKQEIDLPETGLPDWFARSSRFSQSFFTRMLYSCLVDADYLDTEAFMRGTQPRGGYAPLPALLERLRNHTDRLLHIEPQSEINRHRNEILQTCIDCGRSRPRGLYTLTVPTGGGKTTASLAFALEQAVRMGMERVIYVIPYTSVIDQTVEVFSGILGAENVLAHYAGADWQLSDREDLSPEDYRRVLAAENWDAPVIATTAVQFFESLFANRSAKCRKLHSIADSVIIFDEAQTLPQAYLRPCIAAVSELVQHYRTSAVLCTATQPALGPLFQEYGLTAEELCPGAAALYQTLRRAVIRDIGSLPQDALEERLASHRQVLCVVNRRKLAQELYSAMPAEGSFCLTTLLCPADRSRKLNEIRRRLRDGLPCRVISTSLIEAGVDVDFPTAYREEAGLDSLLQTAGRCNREGKEADPARCPVFLFRLDGVRPPDAMKQPIAALRAAKRGCAELDQPDAVEQYFSALLYKIRNRESLDRKGILDACERGREGVQFPFEYAARAFNLIEEPTRTIYVPAEEEKAEDGAELCRQLRSGSRSRTLFRKLGAYSVTVYEGQFRRLYEAGALWMIDDRDAVLINAELYDRNVGLKSDISGGQALYADF